MLFSRSMLSFIRTTSSAGSGTFIFGQTRAVRYVRGSAIALQSIKEGGLIDVILHGTNEHKNGTHSKLLDKGKYVYEFLAHQVKPESAPVYAELMAKKSQSYLIASQQNAKVIGSFSTQIGCLDEYVHLIRYDGYDAYDQVQASRSNEEWKKTDALIRPLLKSRQNELCLEFSFLENGQASNGGRLRPKGIYELRTYALRPGHLLEWASNWRMGMETRKEHDSKLVGAWFSQLGSLYHVHHMWYYESLQARKEQREQSWKLENWAESAAKTVKLSQRMDNRILSLLPATS